MAEILPVGLPPHSVAAEQAVLGALMLDAQAAWPLVAPILAPGDFYRPDHRLLYETIAGLAGKGASADLVSVGAALEAAGNLETVGGHAWLMRLVRETATAVTVEHHARLVRERSQLRQLSEFGRLAEKLALGEDGRSAESIAGQLANRLSAIQSQASVGGGLVPITDVVRGLIDDLDARREGKRGLQTGLADFDHLTGGFEPGELTIFAGRPGMGKTALLCTIAAHVARDAWTAVFSAEMPAQQLARRWVSLLGGPSQEKLRRPERMTEADWGAVTSAVGKLAERRIVIDERASPTMEHIRAQCLGLKARFGVGLVMIDYLQLARARGDKRHEELTNVAYGGKALAKELGCPVIMLSQLNRNLESRDEKRPRMSDLRESGGIEEAADLICMLYREGYYNDRFDMPNVIECMIEKHRNGERGQCLWHFAGEFSRMTALDEVARASYRHLIRSRRGNSGE
jgi:replicative DNA helicase